MNEKRFEGFSDYSYVLLDSVVFYVVEVGKDQPSGDEELSDFQGSQASSGGLFVEVVYSV